MPATRSGHRQLLAPQTMKSTIAKNSTIANKHEFRVLSLRRSGHHAIIYWIASHFHGQVLFANDVAVKNDNPKYPRYYDLSRRTQKSSMLRDAYLFNVEDAELHAAVDNIDRNAWTTDQGASGHIVYLLILRDPYNLFASRLKHSWEGITMDETIVDLWKQHAREFLHLTKILPSNTKCIYYNDWFGSSAYRRALASDLELPATSESAKPFSIIPPFGYGSSFDEMKYNGRAQYMNVLHRWKSYVRDEEFIRYARRDPELHELATAVMGSGRFDTEFASLLI